MTAFWADRCQIYQRYEMTSPVEKKVVPDITTSALVRGGMRASKVDICCARLKTNQREASQTRSTGLVV